MSLLPRMAKIQLNFQAPEVGNVESHLKIQLNKEKMPFKKKARVGIAVGSRGISEIQRIVKTVASFLIEQGMEPIIVPAMGSHGGATAEGQLEVLAGYGITEEEIKIPIEATMDTICIGHTKENIPIFFDKVAASLDGIILVNRVKPHTDFHADYESGLVKQLVVGLGNHAGAQLVHSYGLYGLETLISEMGKTILELTPPILGVAIVENAKDYVAEIEILTKEKILTEEPKLLLKARALMPSLPVDDIDLLIVEEMGKNISGVGIDPNITGRIGIRLAENGQKHPQIRRIVGLDLTSESYGNALGVGLADVITKKLYEKIDFEKTYRNVITSTFLERGFLPIVQPTDSAAIKIALGCAGRKITKQNAKVLHIKNTLDLQEMYISLPLLQEIKDGFDWQKIMEFDYEFSQQGELLNQLGNSQPQV